MQVHPVLILTGLHVLMLSLASYLLPAVRDYASEVFYVFWYELRRLVAGLSLLLPIRLATSNPGYVVCDDSSVAEGKRTRNITSLVGENPSSDPAILSEMIPEPSFQSEPSEELPEDPPVAGSSERSEGLDRLEADESERSRPPDFEVKEPSAEAPTKHVVELYPRYCTVCHVEQPLRAKHCIKCARCVTTYDHHCPFLGTCIGERNRPVFYAYIFAQFLECLSGLAFAMGGLSSASTAGDWMLVNADNLLLGLVCVVFGVFVCSLVVCHSWLALANLTTYEVLRWTKLHYTAQFKRCSSPFSRGWWFNLKDYCWPGSAPIDWQFNV